MIRSKHSTMSLRLNDELFKAIDKAAAGKGYSREAFVRMVLSEELRVPTRIVSYRPSWSQMIRTRQSRSTK